MLQSCPAVDQAHVALLAEGVDRNISCPAGTNRAQVALLAEGVDRNVDHIGLISDTQQSPSSRRAWIEMRCDIMVTLLPRVALLAEGVDRNIPEPPGAHIRCASPSSRRAWIEMKSSPSSSVISVSRPPRGGRG